MKAFYKNAKTQKSSLITVKGYQKTIAKIRFSLDLNYEDTILDLGCGAGNLVTPLLSYCKKLVGIDISRDTLIEAKKGMKDTSFIVADAENLPLRDESFTKVFAFEVLEHLPDPKKALVEIRRILTKAGFVVMLQQYRLDDYQKRWHRFLYKIRVVTEPRSNLETQHINQLKPQEWIKLLKGEGFKTMRVVPTSVLPPIPFYYGFSVILPSIGKHYFGLPFLRSIDDFLCKRQAIVRRFALANIYISSVK